MKFNFSITFDELKENTKDLQTDKDDKLVILYSSDIDAQHSYIKQANAKGYKVLLLDSPIIGHLIQKMEGNKENISFARAAYSSADSALTSLTTSFCVDFLDIVALFPKYQ